MNLSVLDKSGGPPDYISIHADGRLQKRKKALIYGAEEPQAAKRLYDYFVEQAASRAEIVQSGEFQSMMKIELVNDGPVTILLDSKKAF